MLSQSPLYIEKRWQDAIAQMKAIPHSLAITRGSHMMEAARRARVRLISSIFEQKEP